MFHQSYGAVEKLLRMSPWYVELNMETGVLVWPVFNSLQVRKGKGRRGEGRRGKGRGGEEGGGGGGIQRTPCLPLALSPSPYPAPFLPSAVPRARNIRAPSRIISHTHTHTHTHSLFDC